MTFPKIEEALTAHWGERCKEHKPGCPVCDAWTEYDNLCQGSTPEGLSRALARNGYAVPARVLEAAMKRGAE